MNDKIMEGLIQQMQMYTTNTQGETLFDQITRLMEEYGAPQQYDWLCDYKFFLDFKGWKRIPRKTKKRMVKNGWI